ncbi:MAG: O-antigen biosynthesis protein [Erysipelotrichaceae bacterium]|nr:MAG: O-antigen biosynthesis protein [Erysipelotrichaceae bacterium]
MYKPIKRCIDFIISLIGLLVLSPIFLLIAVIIKLESKGKVLFKQKRLGKDKCFFDIYKFRTMLSSTPKDMPTHLLLTPEKFITKSGAFLRKSSLDELPQLINILVGDMSIVGPRPALWNQDDLIAEREKVGANDILPGLTGWAQINGRDELHIELKAKLDGQYVKEMSLWLDIKIFFLTIFKVFRSEGIQEGKRQ